MSLSNAIFWENYAVSDILKLTNDVKLIDGFQTYVSNLTGVELSNKPYENEPITLSTIVTPITRSDLDNINYSNDDSLNALLDKGVNLNYLTPVRNIIYYSFDSQNFNDQVINTKIAPFNQAQQKTTRSILNYASIVTGIQFQEVALSQNADLHFANTDLYGTRMTGLTNKYSNYQYDVQTDVITNYSVNIYVYLDNVEFAKNNETPISGTLGYEILLHEVGHALGLKHPFESPYVLPAVQDNTENTVMSYSLKGDYKTKFQPLDLAALNWIYCGDGLGGKSNSSMPMAANSGDYLIGTEKANKLIGSAGNDTLDGGAGRDTLIGGDGNDIYIVDNAFDKIIETSLIDKDFVRSSVNYTLPKNVENLLLTGNAKTGIGNELANKLVGNGLANNLSGKAGDDSLEGGGNNEKLTGGGGNDTFIFNIKDYDFLGDFAARAQNIDTISDFTKGKDHIELSTAFAFKGFVVTKSLKSFVGDESLIFNVTNSTLYFDADGSEPHYTPAAVIKFIGKVTLDTSDLQFINDTIG